MKDRIKIDDVWYVRENSEDTTKNIHYTFTENYICETGNYCYEAVRIRKDDGSFYDGISITTTIKDGNRKDWREEYWDNNEWMVNILKGDKDAIAELDHKPQDFKVFTNFLRKLINIGWLKDE